MKRSMNAQHLAVFREVARAGSFSGAARALGYSQPAISQQIQALERSLGTPLLVRTGRTMLLTEAGEALVAHAEHLLDELGAAEAEIRSIAQLNSGTVRIGAVSIANSSLVPQMIVQLSQNAPGVTVRVVEALANSTLDLLRSGECDVAVTLEFAPAEDTASLLRVPLFEDELVVLTSSAMPLPTEPEPLSAYADHQWIAGCPRCSAFFVDLCRDAGFEPEVVCATDDNLSKQNLVAARLGSAMMPSLAVSFLRHPNLQVHRLAPAPRLSVVAYTWPRMADTPAVATVLETLQRVGLRQKNRTERNDGHIVDQVG